MSHVRVVAVKSINNAAANKAQLKISEGGDASPHRPFLFLSHHLGLQFLRSEGFLLRPHSEYGVQFFLTPYLSVLRCQHGLLFHGFVIVIVIALVEQHERYPILGI